MLRGVALIVSFVVLLCPRQILAGRGVPPETAPEYLRTDRGLRQLQYLYPPDLMDIRELRTKRILDAGAGDGKFVMDLRQHGIRASGVDREISRIQKLFGCVRKADVRNTGFRAGSFDVIYSTKSIFYYELHHPRLMEETLRELARILRPGGEIRLFGLGRYDSELPRSLNRSSGRINSRSHYAQLRAHVNKIKGLTLLKPRRRSLNTALAHELGLPGATTRRSMDYSLAVIRKSRVRTAARIGGGAAVGILTLIGTHLQLTQKSSMLPDRTVVSRRRSG